MQDEDDLSAKNQAEGKGSWLQGQDEDCRRKKGFSSQKGLRQPSFIFLALWVKENL